MTILFAHILNIFLGVAITETWQQANATLSSARIGSGCTTRCATVIAFGSGKQLIHYRCIFAE